MSLKIGELATRANCPVVTVRFYEKEGLLPEPHRTQNNYRLYTERHLERLVFILRCRSLDMTLNEIRGLLAFKDDPQADCSDVNALIDLHLQHIAQRIAELQTLEAELVEIRGLCKKPGTAAECPVLDELSQPEIVPAKVKSHLSRTHQQCHQTQDTQTQDSQTREIRRG